MGCQPSKDSQQHSRAYSLDGTSPHKRPVDKKVELDPSLAAAPAEKGHPGELRGATAQTLASSNGNTHPPAIEAPSTDASLNAQAKQVTVKKKSTIKQQEQVKRKSLDDRMNIASDNQAHIPKAKKGVSKTMDVHTGESDVVKALTGDVDMTCPPDTKIVRIFTSSTFTDTKEERNMLMKHAYPAVKAHCRRIGYEFQVVDMRWGVRDEAADDHMTTEICMKELKLCQKVSTGPNFVYGYQPFPRAIEATEFEAILAGMDDEDSTLLKSSLLPDFVSADKEKKAAAKTIWWESFDKIQDALYVASTRELDKQIARKYIMSVTETEVTDGLLTSEDPSKHCLWFKRNIVDVEAQPSSYLLSRFIECTGPEDKMKRSREMLRELKEEMAMKLPSDRIINYDVLWNQDKGINPEAEKRHIEYLDKMCQDFVRSMTEMIDQSVKSRTRVDDPMIDECCQHIRFCQTKCDGFQGREDTLELIKKYVQGTSSYPLVLHGTSGTGKTSILAMAAKKMKAWTAKSPALVLRFLGTSPSSSSLPPLLDSLTAQIRRVYRLDPIPPGKELYHKQTQFNDALALGCAERPLVLMLDSLDQLDPAYDARKLAWLLVKVPPGTRIIVSTLPEPQYDCFPALKNEITAEANFISVPVLHKKSARAILDNWLASRSRCLTDQQMTIVLDAFRKCPTPLFLKLSFEKAASWASFTPPAKTILQNTARASIDFLFQKLEKVHGYMLLSRALGYLTTANNGATEAELEDILSCDDDVLNDLYMYWTPPIRRLPPLLLVRVRTDLSQYLVERGADGVRVIYWYHRQFIEAAGARYCSDEVTNRLLHERLADFFHGTWAGGEKKPYTNAKGESGKEDRHVSPQPLKFADRNYNLRTLNNLPFHRVQAGQVALLKDQCLASPNFLIHKLEAVPFYSVLRDYTTAKQAFPGDDLISEVLQALRLSEKGLTTDPRQLIPQLLQRLEETQTTSQFLQRCRDYPMPYLLPSQRVLDRPGGQLVHNIPAHNGTISDLDLTTDGKLAVTVCTVGESSVKLWDVIEGRQKREVKGLDQCTNARFCNHDKWLVCSTHTAVIVHSIESGKIVRSLSPVDNVYNGDKSFGMCGKGRRYIVQFTKQKILLTDLQDVNQNKTEHISSPQDMAFGWKNLSTGSDNYLAVCDHAQDYICVYDFKAAAFRNKFRAAGEKVGVVYGKVYDMAIMPDESCLAFMRNRNNEVVFADFDGNRLRRIPGDVMRKHRSLSFTQDGCYVYTHDSSRKILYIFDTQSLKMCGTVGHDSSIVRAKSNDMRTVLTVSDGGDFCIWDRSRPDKQKDLEQRSAKFHSIRMVHMLNNPRYVLLGVWTVTGQYSLHIYDNFNNTSVAQVQLDGLGDHSDRVHVYSTSNDNQVIMLADRKILRFDLQTMKVLKEYAGFTTSIAVAEKTEEVFCTTEHNRHVKLYDKNGDVFKVIKAKGEPQESDGRKKYEVRVNRNGTIGCAQTGHYTLLLVVYDLTHRKHLYNIKEDQYELAAWCFSMSDTKLVYGSNVKTYPPQTRASNVVVWDIQARPGREVARLVDHEMLQQYKADKSHTEKDLAADKIHVLDDHRVISTHHDDIIRIWSLKDGKLLTRMRGHTNSIQVSLSQRSPYILSYGSENEDNYLRVWDATTYTLVASFSLDKTMGRFIWSNDARFVISNTNDDLFFWKIYHGHDQFTVNETDYPETFKPNPKGYEAVNIKRYTANCDDEENDF